MPEPEGIAFLLFCAIIAGSLVMASIAMLILALVKKSKLFVAVSALLAVVAIPPGAFVGMWIHYWITN